MALLIVASHFCSLYFFQVELLCFWLLFYHWSVLLFQLYVFVVIAREFGKVVQEGIFNRSWGLVSMEAQPALIPQSHQVHVRVMLCQFNPCLDMIVLAICRNNRTPGLLVKVMCQSLLSQERQARDVLNIDINNCKFESFGFAIL